MTMIQLAFRILSTKKTAMCVIVGLLFIVTGLSQVYKYKDKDGNIVYSSNPPPGVETEKKKVVGDLETSGAGAANGAKPVGRSPDLKRPYRDIKVIMYMTDWSDYCKRSRTFLKTLGVNLIEYDIEKDAEKKKEQLQKSGGQTSVPLFDIEGTIVHGYGTQSIQAAVEAKRSALRPY